MDGGTLRRLREYHGLTQTAVAHAARMHQSDVSAVESGRKTSVEVRKRVARGILRATSPSRVVRMHGSAMRTYLEREGIGRPRVFGSVARGEDRWDSDIDIVAALPSEATLIDLGRWEEGLTRIAGGIRVELVPEGAGFARLGTAAADAVPL